jgi:hypothetical protein
MFLTYREVQSYGKNIICYLSLGFELNPSAELGQQHQVKDDGRGKERVLAGVVQHNGVLAAHEYLRGVFVHGPLAVADVGDVLHLNIANYD